jgi:hypothetical protein
MWNPFSLLYSCVGILTCATTSRCWQRNLRTLHRQLCINPPPATGTCFLRLLPGLWPDAFKVSYSDWAYDCPILFPTVSHQFHHEVSHTLCGICHLPCTIDSNANSHLPALFPGTALRISIPYTCIFRSVFSPSLLRQCFRIGRPGDLLPPPLFKQSFHCRTVCCLQRNSVHPPPSVTLLLCLHRLSKDFPVFLWLLSRLAQSY